MAKSGSKSVSVTSWNTLKFSWEITSQSIANNTSTVSWKMQLIAGSSGRINSSASKAWSVTVNGTKYSGTNKVGISSGETITLASGTTTIKHNSDGTKTFSYSFSQEFSITFSSAWVGTKSGSGSGTLDTIHQKSTLAASNGTLGTAQTLTVTRQSSSLTHTITYKCGSASGTVCTKSSSTNINFTPPLSLASQNTTGATVSVVFTITTYSGSTSVGSNTKTISCAIPSSVKPTLSISVSDATGHSGTYGGYLQNLSKFKVSLTASGAYGSSIKSYKTTADGKTYTAASFTSGVISGSGALKINATVTDSRGRTATASTTVNVIAYSAPKVKSLDIKRCDAEGSGVSNGDHILVVFDANITSLSDKNTAAYVLQYKKTTETAYTEIALDDYDGIYSVTDGTCIFAADVMSTYDVVVIATDAFSSTKRGGMGSSVSKLFSLFKRGMGLAFGKIAELENTIEFAFETKFHHGEVPQDALTINAGDNLDDYTMPGYYVFSHSASATIGNLPIGGSASGAVEIIREGDGTQVRQVVTRCSVYREIWERLYYSETWHEWLCVYKGGTGRILWNGTKYMTSGHTAALSERISAQPSGVVLVFARYESGTPNDNFTSFFVSKHVVAAHPGAGMNFFIPQATLDYCGTKYLYISDDQIIGDDNNNKTGTSAAGITYTNNKFVLRYVIGV